MKLCIVLGSTGCLINYTLIFVRKTVHILGWDILLRLQDIRLTHNSTYEICTSISVQHGDGKPLFIGSYLFKSITSSALWLLWYGMWKLPTPWTAAASAANLPHNDPTPLAGLSNQPISCFNIAANAATLYKLNINLDYIQYTSVYLVYCKQITNTEQQYVVRVVVEEQFVIVDIIQGEIQINRYWLWIISQYILSILITKHKYYFIKRVKSVVRKKRDCMVNSISAGAKFHRKSMIIR